MFLKVTAYFPKPAKANKKNPENVIYFSSENRKYNPLLVIT